MYRLAGWVGVAMAALLPWAPARSASPAPPATPGVAVAGASDDASVCARVPAAEVLPLMTRMPLAVRASHRAEPRGGTACVWSAVDPGLVADAPPRFQLVATVDGAAAAARGFQRRFGSASVPGLVRTGPGTPEVTVARPGENQVALRVGATVVEIDATGQQEEVMWTPGRFYRLEALGLRLAGATPLGPVDPDAVRDACEPLPPQHVLGILTLQPSSLAHDGDDHRCTLDVKDGSSRYDGWVDNHGEVEIRRSDLGTHAAALAFQHQQYPFLPVSRLVRTVDPGDRLVANASAPTEAYAVHGATLIELNVTNPTPRARAAPGWLYRVQRVALEAAGATVVPTPGQAPLPEPVVLAPMPRLDPIDDDDGGAAAAPWTPPPHPAPMDGALDGPVAGLAWLGRHRFFLLPFAIVVPIGVGMLLGRAGGLGRRLLGVLMALAIGLPIANMLGGTWVSDWLIYHLGESGAATVTGSHATAIQYNNHDVEAHDVLIRTVGGQVVETGFEDDDFNVYPSHNLTRYPGVGTRFTARYLRHHPRTFVIVGDDASPWARGVACGGLEQQAAEAADKSHFAPDSAAMRAALEATQRTLRAAGCVR